MKRVISLLVIGGGGLQLEPTRSRRTVARLLISLPAAQISVAARQPDSRSAPR